MSNNKPEIFQIIKTFQEKLKESKCIFCEKSLIFSAQDDDSISASCDHRFEKYKMEYVIFLAMLSEPILNEQLVFRTPANGQVIAAYYLENINTVGINNWRETEYGNVNMWFDKVKNKSSIKEILSVYEKYLGVSNLLK